MQKIKPFNIGYVWVDVWQEGEKYFFEPYVVKRDGSGRSAKASTEELIIMIELLNKAKREFI